MTNGSKALAIAAFGMLALLGTVGLTLYTPPESDRTMVAATLVFLQGVVTTAVGVLSGAYRPDGADTAAAPTAPAMPPEPKPEHRGA